MCARYVSKVTAEWERWFRRRFRVDFSSYNVVPTQVAPIVRAGTQEGELLRFGLVPYFCRGAKPKNPNINAAMERLIDAPSWRGPWKRGQRCLVIANGFYEPHVEANGRRQPFYIHLVDREAFAFAGIWDRSVAVDGNAVESFAIVTLPASPLMASIHNKKQRMPAILAAEDHEQWLNGTAEAARSVLKPYPDELLVAWPVNIRVNKSNQNDPELIVPMRSSPWPRLELPQWYAPISSVAARDSYRHADRSPPQLLQADVIRIQLATNEIPAEVRRDLCDGPRPDERV